MAKVTIIVPIYNVEKYVATCLESLLKQTFTDFEIYAVIDGSPGNEKEIVAQYVKKDARVLLIEKENGGYGSVLQEAIARCSSEYFLVCDPDDYLADDALEKLVKLADENQSDLTVGAKYYIYEGSTDQDFDPSYNTKYVTLKKEEAYEAKTKEFDDLFFLDASPHTKLYRTRVAKNIQFPTKISFTDNVLFYCFLLQAKKVVYTDEARAYYLVDRAGNTMTDIQAKVINQNIQAFTSVMNQAAAMEDIPAFFYYRMFETYKYVFQMLRRVKGNKEEMDAAIHNLKGFVNLLKPHRKDIFVYYDTMNLYGANEQKKDKLLLSPIGFLSNLSFHRSVKQILSEKE